MSAKPGIKPATLWLEGRDFTNCTNHTLPANVLILVQYTCRKQMSVNRLLLMRSHILVFFFSGTFLFTVLFLTPCKVIRDRLGFQIPWCGIRIPGTGFKSLSRWIPDSNSSVFRDSRFHDVDSESQVLDSKVYLGGFRILIVLFSGNPDC